MRALLLVNHGPELRSLESLIKSGAYSEVSIMAEAAIAQMAHSRISAGVNCISYSSAVVGARSDAARYSSMLIDSIARRVNRMRGIGHYSYSRRQSSEAEEKSVANSPLFKLAEWALGVLIRVTYPIVAALYWKRDVANLLRRSGCDVLVCLDHLGGTDLVAINARISGLDVHYFLNNHKDLSIRPYVPLPGVRMFCWFDSQRSMLLDVVASHRRTYAKGILRVNALKSLAGNGERATASSVARVLHCLSDPARRPYETQSLEKIFELVKIRAQPVHFTLRTNPMGAPLNAGRLSAYPFVTIVSHGWHWDSTNFLNFPDLAAEAAYARQLADHDVISALPSTTLVEGDCFGKDLICLLDVESPDANAELAELKLCLPQDVLLSKRTVIARSPAEYVEALLRGNHGD